MSVFQAQLLAGQTVLITGGSSGINLGIACCYAAQGATVIIVARNPERLQAAAVRIGELNGGRVHTCRPPAAA